MVSNLSIIIPVYNVRKYLIECLDSVLAACANASEYVIEVICVDDGSTDGSGDILDKYCNRVDNRSMCINVVHLKNGGVSAARNYGKSISRGEYIWFVDSDDVISLNSICRLMQLVKQFNHPDIIQFERSEFVSRPIFPYAEDDSLSICYDCTNRRMRRAAYIKCIDWLLAWSAIYKRSLVSDMQFAPIPNGEDTLWGTRAFYAAKSLVKSPSRYYGYRIRSDGANSDQSLRKYNSLKYVFSRVFIEGVLIPGLTIQVMRRALSDLNTLRYFRKKLRHLED